MNRRERRRLQFTNAQPSTNGWTRQPHLLDDDCCCFYCGFDAAEEYHLRVTSVPPHARESKPDFAIYCSRRPLIKK